VVLVLGLLLALAVTASILVGFLAPYAERALSGESVLVVTFSFAFTFAVVTLFFAAFFRVLPDVRISWRHVRVGAAGSLLGVLMWAYHSAQAYFFGAEFTQVWARRYGGRIEPARGAVRRER
jgi:membrane protein